MPKSKNHKGLLKRIRITKTGLIRHRTAGRKHLRSGKGGKKLRQYRAEPYMSSADAKRLEKLLFRRIRGREQPLTALRKSPSPAERAGDGGTAKASGAAVKPAPKAKRTGWKKPGKVVAGKLIAGGSAKK